MMPVSRTQPPVAWIHSTGLVPYEAAVEVMRVRAEGIATGSVREAVWLLEHPPLYTAGTSARPADLIDPQRFPVHATGRGGQFTYHGPGQRVVYVMLDVKRRFRDVRAFVTALEMWIIDVLAEFGVQGYTRPDRVGVWIDHERGAQKSTDKIAAIGIRLRRWISMHGFSVNVAPDLTHFTGIVPCGIADAGVTSLADLGRPAIMPVLDTALRTAFERRFAETIEEPAPQIQP